MPRTFRYQLGDEILASLRPFAERHALTTSAEFKSHWDLWCTMNATLIDTEAARLKDQGYNGDTHGKLYRATRYYFKNSPPSLEQSRRSNRCVYITLAPQLLQAMDEHLRTFVSSDSAKPAALYQHFLATRTDLVPLLTTEIQRMLVQGGFDNARALAKVKKTYKNRYFLMTQAKLSSYDDSTPHLETTKSPNRRKMRPRKRINSAPLIVVEGHTM